MEGVGKTTLAAQFPDPLFIDCEGGTDNFDVARFQRPTSWEMLLQEVEQIKQNPSMCSTLVIDTIDWAEAEAIRYVCDSHQVKNIEDFGWSKGYTYLNEEMGRLLNLLTEVRDVGINVVLTAHMNIRTISLPDDSGAYDRYELKLKTAKNGNNSQLVKEWADMVLFLNYKQYVVKDEKTKQSKVTGGRERVMYTNHTAAYDAKNRFGLPDELPMTFESIAHLFASAPEKKAKEMLARGSIIAGATNYTRDIVNEIPQIYTPARMAKDAEKLAKDLVGVTCKVFGKSYLAKENMNLFLAVNQAGPHEPKLVHLTYKPAGKAKKKIAFVGKGLTYDTGGLSLKSGTGMYTMKSEEGSGSSSA